MVPRHAARNRGPHAQRTEALCSPRGSRVPSTALRVRHQEPGENGKQNGRPGPSPRLAHHGLTGAEVSRVTLHDLRTFSQSFLAESSWEKTGEFLIPSTHSRFTLPIPTSLLLTPGQYLNQDPSVRTPPSNVYDLIILRGSGVRTEVSPARPGSGRRSPPRAVPPGTGRATGEMCPRRPRRHSGALAGVRSRRDLSPSPFLQTVVHPD